MIGLIKGIVEQKSVPRVLVETATGLSYEIETSMTTFFQLPEVGTAVKLYIHLIIREDAQILYGFIDETERSLFRSLIKVNGIGPKLALVILSGITPQIFVHCVRDNDTATLVRLPGIGQKTAERLVIEMRDKLDHWQPMLPPGIDKKAADKPNENSVLKDAIKALVSLGYKPQEASRAIAKMETAGLSSEEVIHRALKGMVVHD